jgi:serine/threonine-protein kinase HipA
MSTRELAVLMRGAVAGRLRQDARGELLFEYAATWRESLRSYPLSISMPLGQWEHGDAIVRPWLEGLLPDNDALLARWGRLFGVSPRNPFALLGHIGEDCAGAVQFVAMERADEILGEQDPPVEWLSEADVAERLREMRMRELGERHPTDPGSFSLAGAQAKTALLLENGRWGVPSGRVPTTHILKPPAGDYQGFAENEHLCLRLANALGIPAAQSEVSRFGDEVAIVVERYDRLRADGRWTRVHQEDFCQALSVTPRNKYQSDGGPGIAAIFQVLRRHSAEPVRDGNTLLRSIALNWAIGGTDAHAKNYSVLIAPGQVRLAPLYDLISVLPYPKQVPPRKAKLAMRIGGEYALWKIDRRHWERLGDEIGIGAEAAVQQVRDLVARVPDAIATVTAAARAKGMDHPIVDTLQTKVTEHATACLRRLDAAVEKGGASS